MSEIDIAVDVKIKRLFSANSTVPSSTKNFFSSSVIILIIPGLKKVIKDMPKNFMLFRKYNQFPKKI